MSQKSLPTITDARIRERATDGSWSRGLGYVDHVIDPVWRDGVLSAMVQGSEYEPYAVEVVFDDDAVVSATCTCPYALGGDCKHIVAVLYFLMQHGDEIDVLPSLDALVANLDRNALTALLAELVRTQPQLMTDIERALVQLQVTSVPSTTPVDAGTLDLGLLRRQVKADVRGSIETGYDGWGDEAWYDSDLGAALDPALERAGALLDAGDPRSALVLLEAAFDAWQEGIDTLDEYLLEHFEDVASEFLDAFTACWTEAFLLCDLTMAERTAWSNKLTDLAADAFGGDALEMVITAVEQGWDSPPLAAAMQGNITDRGVWEDEAPWYADELAQIRLRILESRGDYAAYLNLAEAEGQYMSYLHMLAKQGQHERVLEEAASTLQQPGDILALAKTLHAHGATDTAIALSRHGLTLAGQRDAANLAAWLRDVAAEEGDSELALTAGRRALTLMATLDNYLVLQEIAGTQWPEIRPDLLEVVDCSNLTGGKIDIYLHERMYDKVIATVNEASSYYVDLDKVLAAVQADYPDWAFRQCARRAEEIMNAGRSKDYDAAAAWLRRGRDILIAADERDAWTGYLTAVMEKHARKHSLMPKLRLLR